MGAPFPLRSVEPVALDDYIVFREARPERERWTLLEGVAFMMPPPSVRHQRLTLNLINILNEGLDRIRPEWVALGAVGLAPRELRDFRPEPDVAVIEARQDDRVWSENFLLAAEVVSEANTTAMLLAKQKAYTAHPACLHVLVVEQKEPRIGLLSRTSDFREVRLSGLATRLEMPEFGVSCTLADIYRHIGF
ncbi:MAG: Uma2 family endonuclease [Beijerinckiaceae bacterium]